MRRDIKAAIIFAFDLHSKVITASYSIPILQDVEEKTEDEVLATATSTVVHDLFEANVINSSKCRCSKEKVRESSTMLVTVSYPEYFKPSKLM